MIVGTGLADAIGHNSASAVIGAILAAITAAIVMAALWTLVRKNRDLAMGVIIGGALVVILSGGCGALLSSFSGL